MWCYLLQLSHPSIVRYRLHFLGLLSLYSAVRVALLGPCGVPDVLMMLIMLRLTYSSEELPVSPIRLFYDYVCFSTST